MPDGAANGVEQCRATADVVLLLRDRRDFPDLLAIANDLDPVIEEHRRDDGVALLLLVLTENRVESADGVSFQSAHRAAAIEDENEFRVVLHVLHGLFPSRRYLT